jgi:hypothetical protein
MALSACDLSSSMSSPSSSSSAPSHSLVDFLRHISPLSPLSASLAPSAQWLASSIAKAWNTNKANDQHITADAVIAVRRRAHAVLKRVTCTGLAGS